MSPSGVAVFLAAGPMDLRGSFDRLAAVTRQVLRLDPASGALFLFVNRRRERVTLCVLFITWLAIAASSCPAMRGSCWVGGP